MPRADPSQQQRAGRSMAEERHSLFRCRIGPARARPPPHFPTSSRRSTASLATIPGSVYTNHPRPDSPLQLGITLCLSPLAALRSKGSLLFPSHACASFSHTQNPITASNITSQWVASERNPPSALCVWPTLHRVAQRYYLYPVDKRIYSMLTRHPEP